MDEALNIVGLAYRARKTVLGEEVYHRIGKVRIILIASDISEKSRQRAEKKCYFYDIGHIDCFTAEELSAAIGRNNVRLIGIIDEGFKDALLKKLKKEDCHGETDVQKTSE
jgi:ribosomal protein L7Ae-like RNA K-turn-binding protein